MISSIAIRPLALMLLLALSLAFSACAGSGGEPLQYTDRDEIPEGPGLLTGEDGAFTLEFGAGASGDKAGGAPESDSSDVSYQEFKAFKQYQESGQQDSGTLDDETLSREYEEFQRWRESREYQDWKNSRQGTQ